MSNVTRRDVLGLIGALALPALGTGFAAGAVPPRIVVIGGGFGGATFAKYMRRAHRTAAITLVEPKSSYISCVYSNEALVGMTSLDRLTRRYDTFAAKYAIHHLRARATWIDPVRKRISLATGESLFYDKLVFSPGVAFRYDAIDGWDRTSEHDLPSAWHAGPETTELAARLRSFPAGGTAIISVPRAPYRCPPAPYERASLVAWSLKRRGLAGRVIILDANDAFPKQPLFEEGWQRLFPGIVTRIAGSAGGEVVAVDAATSTVTTAGAGRFRGDFVNIIPPQKAGILAERTGLTDLSGWCPVDPRSFASKRRGSIHVIGDAAASGLPKSGTSANAGAKVAALAIAERLAGRPVDDPLFVNTCYSTMAPDYAIGIVTVFGVDANGFVAPRLGGAGSGQSPLGASLAYRRKEADDSQKWFRSLLADSFG